MFVNQLRGVTSERPATLADHVGARVVEAKSTAQRKAGGLYLTPVPVADFMADQVAGEGASVRILDPAAGSGTLICAVVERLASKDSALREVHITAYETEPDLQDALTTAVEHLRRWAMERRIVLSAKIERRDFLLAHPQTTTGHLFRSEKTAPFDLVVANPPYFKLAKHDTRAEAAAPVVHGQPNIYALFMATGASLLREGGQLLFITPRSFTSGPYFRLFREAFFASVRPTKVHVFSSRRDTFGRDDVLQENIILSGLRDSGWQSRSDSFELCISSSTGVGDLHCPSRQLLRLEEAFANRVRERVLRLPVVEEELRALRFVDSWQGSLHQHGMNISTGPVVAFRATEFLDSHASEEGCVPLVWMNHVRAMRVRFPGRCRKPQFIRQGASEKSLLLPNRNYVLLRRFSAKEEARRLVAAPWLRHTSTDSLLGIENHLNYIYRLDGELTEDEAFGLSALLNSRLLDTFFRVSNGNTQVSATELRAMPLPTLNRIIEMGRRARKRDAVEASLDDIVEQEVGFQR